MARVDVPGCRGRVPPYVVPDSVPHLLLALGARVAGFDLAVPLRRPAWTWTRPEGDRFPLPHALHDGRDGADSDACGRARLTCRRRAALSPNLLPPPLPLIGGSGPAVLVLERRKQMVEYCFFNIRKMSVRCYGQ